MISVTWRDGDAIVVDGELTALPASTEKRVAAVLAKPARVQMSVPIEGGGIEEALVPVQPGEPGHARAALLSLPGARLVVDEA